MFTMHSEELKGDRFPELPASSWKKPTGSWVPFHGPNHLRVVALSIFDVTRQDYSKCGPQPTSSALLGNPLYSL